jgi:hypothetical protein
MQKECERVALLVAGSVGLWALLVLASRRALLDWGASKTEAASVLPGDDLVPHADLVATRAISIAAPPALVWPWLVQIGIGRAGAYSYDWLERLFGLDVHSSHAIVPELQHLAVGDVIPVEQDGRGLRVQAIEAESVLVTRTDDGDWSWTWVLRPMGDGTRLLSRTRMRTNHRSWLARASVAMILVPASWAMEHRMLLGLRQRAERGSVTSGSTGGH